MSGMGQVLKKHLKKEHIACAVQSGLPGGDDGPVVETINAEIQGFIPALANNLATQSQFGYGGNFGYDTDLYPVIPVIEEPINKACGTGSNETSVIGTLVIDPKLPPGSSDVFDLKITPKDISAGMGSIILFCPATGQFTAPQGSYSGPVGQVRTIAGLDASSLNCNIEDVRVGFLAFGANGNALYEGNCDEICDEVGTIVAVTPSECQPAAGCLSDLLGCDLSGVLSTTDVIKQLNAKLDSLTKERVVWSLDNTVTGFKWETWQHPADRQADEAAFEKFWGGPVVNGIPTHVNGAPNSSGVETDTRFAQSERGYDGHRLTYCIDNREGTQDLVLEDTDARAESLRVYLGCSCHSNLVYERYQNPDGGPNNPPYDSDGQPVATIPAGKIMTMTVLIHDPGPDFSGFRPVPISGGTGTGDNGFTTYSRKPVVNSRTVSWRVCGGVEYTLKDNESFEPISLECGC